MSDRPSAQWWTACSFSSRMLKKEGKGSLVVLLLAERAHSEDARSTRAIEDRPSHPFRDSVKHAAAAIEVLLS